MASVRQAAPLLFVAATALGLLRISDWLRDALLSALERDPVEAAADAGLLSIVLDYRANSKDAESKALQAILAAKLGTD